MTVSKSHKIKIAAPFLYMHFYLNEIYHTSGPLFSVIFLFRLSLWSLLHALTQRFCKHSFLFNFNSFYVLGNTFSRRKEEECQSFFICAFHLVFDFFHKSASKEFFPIGKSHTSMSLHYKQ